MQNFSEYENIQITFFSSAFWCSLKHLICSATYGFASLQLLTMKSESCNGYLEVKSGDKKQAITKVEIGLLAVRDMKRRQARS